MLAFDVDGGLAAAGFITVAVTLTRYVDRADQIVTATIYPAICAMRGRTAALEELFVKSNRATLLWVFPFTIGLVLFAPDLVDARAGRRVGAGRRSSSRASPPPACSTHLGFNWFSFYRAHSDTRPPAIEAVVGAAAFSRWRCPGCSRGGPTASSRGGSRACRSRWSCAASTSGGCCRAWASGRSRGPRSCRWSRAAGAGARAAAGAVGRRAPGVAGDRRGRRCSAGSTRRGRCAASASCWPSSPGRWGAPGLAQGGVNSPREWTSSFR